MAKNRQVESKTTGLGRDFKLLENKRKKYVLYFLLLKEQF